MKTAKTGIQIHERGRDALGKLHKILLKLGYVREEDASRGPFYTYRRESAKPHRKVAKIMLDIKRHTINAGSKSATLNNHECLLLKYFIKHPYSTLPRDVIPTTVFGNTDPPGSDTISPCICTLRRNLHSPPQARVHRPRRCHQDHPRHRLSSLPRLPHPRHPSLWPKCIAGSVPASSFKLQSGRFVSG